MGELILSPSYNYLPENIRMMIPDFPDLLYFKSLAGHGDSYLLKTLPLLSRLDPKRAIRLNIWFAFFNQYDDFGFAFFTPMSHALVQSGCRDQLLLQLTDHQTLDAMDFMRTLLKARPYMRFKSNDEALLLLQIASYYSAYRPLVRRPLIMCLGALGDQLTTAALKEFFLKLFVQWEYPKWLAYSLPYLKADEVDIVMMCLQGSNIKNHPALPCTISSKEAHLIVHEIDPYSTLKDNIILRASIHAKFLMAFPETLEKVWTSEFFRLSRTYQDSPQEFLNNIKNWQKALKLILSPGWPLDQAPLSQLVDYLEYNFRDNPNYQLRGRTPHSLSREVIDWHERITKIDIDNNAVWKGSSIPDSEIDFKDQRFAFKQLLTGKELAKESKVMRHCVSSYTYSCQRGQCSIWSLRLVNGNEFKRLLTLELRGRHIFQIKGFGNRDPKPSEHIIIKEWMKLNGIRW